MTAYWLYGRLGVHVCAPERELMAALDRYAEAHIIGGSAMLSADTRAAVRDEHREARELYLDLQNGYL